MIMELILHTGSYVISAWGIMFSIAFIGAMFDISEPNLVENFKLGLSVMLATAVVFGGVYLFAIALSYIMRGV